MLSQVLEEISQALISDGEAPTHACSCPPSFRQHDLPSGIYHRERKAATRNSGNLICALQNGACSLKLEYRRGRLATGRSAEAWGVIVPRERLLKVREWTTSDCISFSSSTIRRYSRTLRAHLRRSLIPASMEGTASLIKKKGD